MTNTKLGLTLSSEEHTPRRLVELAAEAEQHGFDFVSISDHFHPWIDAQGHSPFVWAVLGGIAERTTDLQVAVGVTCPTTRIHPVILAQATATVANLMPGRFTWGVGTGEALNEHITGVRWPPAPVRLAQLEEAIGLIRRMWTGDVIDHDGQYYCVEDARIYDPPDRPVPIIVSAFGPQAAELAARHGDGLWTSGSASEALDHWRAAGGEGPVYSQLTFCWAADRDTAVEQAHRIWPNFVVPGQLSQDLPTPKHFEQATSIVTPQMIAESMPCGPDVDALVKGAQELIDSGVDHLYFHQVGDDQAGFLDVWDREIRPALGSGE
ncbi:MAG TPA: TIGR03557 family F420-dependent LLM class oxidoreductase [Desertimonas sp.]|nr:TIGR03557 family F420-dependent LLM class oxidoreductase [Desertimonas sp.]